MVRKHVNQDQDSARSTTERVEVGDDILARMCALRTDRQADLLADGSLGVLEAQPSRTRARRGVERAVPAEE